MPQQEEEEERLAVKTVTLCREEELEGEEILQSILWPLTHLQND